MSERISSRDIIERLHRQGGMSKKQATSILRAISSVTEAGLQQDGEVRIKGLGTFRLKPVKAKTGRNPKTGERVEIPAHERIVFLPEQSFKEFIANPDELLGYRVPEEKEPEAIKVEYPPLEPSMEEKTTQENIEEPSPEAAGPDSGYNPSVVPSERPFDPMKAETELPPQRKRIHWIIPLAFSIVIILGLVFYLRNFRIEQPTVGSRQSAVGSQQSAVSSQQSAVSSQQSEDRIQKTEDRRQNSEDGIQKTEDRIQKTEDSNLEPGTPEPVTLTEGKHLFQLAREVYDNRPLLWVLIYRANPDKITNPDLAVTGRDIVIPALEGTPWKLTRNDSIAVADGYRMVYEYYLEKGDNRAEDFRLVMLRYKPK